MARRGFRTLQVIVFSSALLVGGVAFSGAAYAADINSCSANVQNPHYSISHGGIDVTATYECSTLHPLLTVFVDYVYLWVCPSSPQKNETYLQEHCTSKGANSNVLGFAITKTNFKYPLTAPAPSSPAAHGSGFWLACSLWYSYSKTHGTGPKILNFSNIVELSG